MIGALVHGSFQFTGKFAVLFALIGGCAALAAEPTAAHAAAIPSSVNEAEMNAFVSGLIKKMTLAEKIGQLNQATADKMKTGPGGIPVYKQLVQEGKVGSLLNAFDLPLLRELQKLAVENSRLKIPLLFGLDIVWGYRTMFPIPLAESASWDLDRIERSAHVAAKEAAADGIDWTFAPMVDIARDPRWGRIAEGAGEDPWYGSLVAAARVRGFQGRDLAAPDSIMACIKHFAAYGAALAGRDYNTTDMSERELFETYLPPYEAAVRAGAATIMSSFNDLNGTPSAANRWLLTDLLRKKWGFKGLVLTDYAAVTELITHGIAEDGARATELAIKAGVDMDMVDAEYEKNLAALVKSKRVSMSEIDAAVRRVLEAKYRRGLFKDPYRFMNDERSKQAVFARENLEASRDIAARSIVLLKNEGSLLPLKKQGTIGLIGPMIDATFGHFKDHSHDVNLIDGMKTALQGSSAKLLTARGAKYEEKHHMSDTRPDQEMLDEAMAVAKKSDVLVVYIGEHEDQSGEAASRTQIRVPENQLNLLKRLATLGKPIVTLISNGRPLVLTDETKLSNALVVTWLLGTWSGHAIPDVLFGDVNPSGKLTATFPVNEGQIPIFYAVRNTGRPLDPVDKYSSKYLDAPNEPLFPFGFGLSYTTYSYAPPRLSSNRIRPGGKITVTVQVTNTGRRDGEEVVQLYIRDLVASVTRPLKQLRGFQKVLIKKGESRDVVFELTVDDLKFYDKNMKWTAEPGRFKVMTGPNSASLQEAEFVL